MSSSDVANALATGNYMWLISATVQNATASPTFAAYFALCGIAPELTGYLEGVEAVVNISTIQEGIVAEYIGKSNGGSLLVNEHVFDTFSNEAVSTILSEELFHAAIRIGTGCEDKFAANEVFAKSMMYNVATELGCLKEIDMWFGVSNFSSFSPFMDRVTLNETLPAASEFLYKNYSGNRYSEGFWFWRKPMRPWSNFDRTGDMFLIVAQNVWIR